MQYVFLKTDFYPIKCDNYKKLYNCKNNQQFEINNRFYNSIIKMDGSLPVENFDKKIIEKLKEIKSLKLYSSSKKRRSFYKNEPKPYLNAIHFAVTRKCNLNCKHCYDKALYNNNWEKDLTFNEIKEFLDQAREMNVSRISYTGGEPFFREDFLDIVKMTVKKGFFINTIYTNGTLATKTKIETLKKIIPDPKKAEIRISLDGFNNTTHSKLRIGNTYSRKNINLWEITMKAIELFSKAGFFVTVNTSLNKFNYTDILKMYDLLKNKKVNQWILGLMYPFGNINNNKNIVLDWNKIYKTWREVLNKHFQSLKNDKKTKKGMRLEISRVYGDQFLNQKINTFKDDDMVCFYYKNNIHLSATGYVYPCVFYPNDTPGTIRKKSLRSLWLDKEMQAIKQIKVKDVSGCKNCPSIYKKYGGTGCRGIAKILTGSIYAKDPYSCKKTAFFINEVLPLLKKYGLKVNYNNGCSEYETENV